MTIDHIIIHDERLEACFQPHGRTQLYVVNGSTPLSRIAEIIRNTANSAGRIDTASRLTMSGRPRIPRGSVPVLSFFAHGVALTEDVRGRDTALQIGREYIHSGNALEFAMSIRYAITEKIRVLGCAMALTEDGRRTCSGLARGAQLPVFASSSIQTVYSQGTTSNDTGIATYRSSRFGRWQGAVYEFSRDGTHRIAWREGADIPRSRPGSARPNHVDEEERLECTPNRNVRHIR